MALMILFLMLNYLLSLVFLLPIKDGRPYQSFPFMTVGLVLLNTVVHVCVYYLLPQWIGEDALTNLLFQMMLVPDDILKGEGLGALSMITAAFLHANWSHLIGNMLFLFFFGRKLEDVLGPAKFGLFYLACVFVSGTGSVLGRAALPLTKGVIPGLGASGAVMGVVAAYLFLYHDQRIRTLVMLAIIPIPFTLRMPAWVFILYTVTRDILSGWLEQQFQAQGYLYSLVDSFAHLGGVMAGLGCLYFFLPSEMLYYRHRGERVQ
ncbi:MAG: rhomboid family intramembrane serine protease [Anaerolineae bacterium]